MSAPRTPYREPPLPGYRVGHTPALARDDTGMVWSWVFLGSMLVPVLIFMAWTAILGGSGDAASARGGTTSFGQGFQYSDGLAVRAELGRDGAAVAVTFTVTNGTEQPIGMGQFRATAIFNDQPAVQAAGTDPLPAQDLAPGRSLTFTQAFVVPSGATGSFQVAVRHGPREPVFFSGPY